MCFLLFSSLYVRKFSRACLRISKLDTKFVYFYFFFVFSIVSTNFEFEFQMARVGCYVFCWAVSQLFSCFICQCGKFTTPVLPCHLSRSYPPTDHIQTLFHPFFGSVFVLGRPRVCRCIYLNVLSRFVLITLPGYTRIHTYKL